MSILTEFEAAGAGLVFISDGSAGSEKLVRVLDQRKALMEGIGRFLEDNPEEGEILLQHIEEASKPK